MSYATKDRHYHNLTHIHNMLKQAEERTANISDYDSLCFCIWYHDIIYKPTNSSNELKSAIYAMKRLNYLNFDQKRLNSVEKLILSTKKHEILISGNEDNRYLLDFDLSILGTDWENYQSYILKIRQEYSIFPDFIYNNGRKKVLKSFLDRNTLYFTDEYQTLYETKARANLKREIALL